MASREEIEDRMEGRAKKKLAVVIRNIEWLMKHWDSRPEYALYKDDLADAYKNLCDIHTDLTQPFKIPTERGKDNA